MPILHVGDNDLPLKSAAELTDQIVEDLRPILEILTASHLAWGDLLPQRVWHGRQTEGVRASSPYPNASILCAIPSQLLIPLAVIFNKVVAILIPQLVLCWLIFLAIFKGLVLSKYLLNDY